MRRARASAIVQEAEHLRHLVGVCIEHYKMRFPGMKCRFPQKETQVALVMVNAFASGDAASDRDRAALN